MKNRYLIYLYGLLLASCASHHEYKLIFSDIGFNAMSIRPVNFSESPFTFRISANNGTSLDRIITISMDTVSMYGILETVKYGDIKYIGNLRSKQGKKIINTYQTETINKNRIDTIINIINTLNLSSYKSRDTIPLAFHTPYSSYVIEIKKGREYHSFRFLTQYPSKSVIDTDYEKLENLFFKLFPELLNIK